MSMGTNEPHPENNSSDEIVGFLRPFLTLLDTRGLPFAAKTRRSRHEYVVQGFIVALKTISPHLNLSLRSIGAYIADSPSETLSEGSALLVSSQASNSVSLILKKVLVSRACEIG